MGFARGLACVWVALGLSVAAHAQTTEIVTQKAKGLRQAKAACRTLPDLPEALCLAETLLAHRRPSLALAQAERAIALDEKAARAYRLQGEALAMLGEAGVEQAFERARVDPTEAALAELGLGRHLIAVGRGDEGVLALRRALAASPTQPDVLFALGRALGPTEEARGYFETALRARPAFAEAALALGQTRQKLGDAGGAESAYRMALDLDPRLVDARIGLATLALRAGRLGEARDALAKAQALVPNDPRTALLLAELHAKTGELESAIAQYRLAGDLDPSDPTGLTRAAELLVADERFSVAEGYLERVLAQHPNDGEALVLYGDVMARRGDKFMARQSYRRALASGQVRKSDVEAKLDAL